MNPKIPIARIAALYALMFSPLSAQAPSVPNASKPEQDTAIQLAPFTVQSGEGTYVVANAMTGTRINMPLVQAPFAIQIVTDEFLKDIGAGNVTEALRYVSSVRSGFNNSETFFIRGFNTGAPLRNFFTALNPSRTRTDNSEYDRLEVLKGPTSLLYGIGSPGGRINTMTKKPLAVKRQSVEIEAGSFDRYRAVFDSTGPVAGRPETGELRYRFIGALQDAEGFRDFEYTRRKFTNAQLEWTAPRLSIRGEFRFLTQDENETYILMPTDPAAGIIVWPERSFNNSGPDTFGKFEEYNGFTEAVWRIDERWSVRNGSTYSEQYYDAVRRSGAGLVAPARIFIRNSASRNSVRWQAFATQTDVTGRIPTSLGPLTLVAGHILENISNREVQFTNTLIPGALFPVYDKAARIYSVGNPADYVLTTSDWTSDLNSRFYAMAQWAILNDRVTFLGGAGRVDIESELTNRIPATPTVTKTKLLRTVPQAGISYKIGNGAHLFAMYGESFAPNSRFPTQPETGKSYEFGLKLSREHVSGSISFFDSSRKDLPANIFDFGVNQYVFGVGGEESSRGVEADFYLRPTKSLDVVASYAFLDTRVVVSDNELLRPDRAGTPISNAPRHQAKLWVRHGIKHRSSWFADSWIGVGVIYNGSMLPDPDVSRYKLVAPSYTRVDLALGATWKLSDKWHAISRLGVENIFNEDYIGQHLTRGAPRTVKATVTFRR